jgi:hypothetical protein
MNLNIADHTSFSNEMCSFLQTYSYTMWDVRLIRLMIVQWSQKSNMTAKLMTNFAFSVFK